MNLRNFIFGCCLLSLNLVMAQDIGPYVNDFLASYSKDDSAGMEKSALQIIQISPDNYAGYAFMGYTSIAKNDLVNAEKYMSVARNINPVDPASYGISAYIEFLKGNTSEAEKLMNYSFQIRTNESLLTGTMGDLNQIERMTGKDLSALKIITNTANSNSTGSPAVMQKYYGCYQNWSEGRECPELAAARTYFSSISPQNPMVIAMTDYYKGYSFYNLQKWDDGKTAFSNFVANPVLVNQDVAYAVAQSYFFLSNYDEFNAGSVYLNATKGLEAISKIPYPTILKCNLLQRKSIALKGLGREDEEMEVTKLLISESKKINLPAVEAQANNTLGIHYLNSAMAGDRQKAFDYLDLAYKQAKQINDEDLVNNIAGNYAIALWQNGRKSEAMEVSTKAYETYLKNQDFPGAQLAANNIGFMSFITEDYTNAAAMFLKAVDITEKYSENLSAAKQLAVMNEHTSAYGGLIMSYQKLNNVSALFETQDLNRSRVLRNKLHIKAKDQSLADIQQRLKGDEVMLYYSQAGPGEMVVSVVTNTEASIGYNYPIDTWLATKKKFINKINKSPNSINGYVTKLDEDIVDGELVHYNDKAQGFDRKDYEQFVALTRELLHNDDENYKTLQTQFLKQWYTFLISPVESKIAGKKTLIISGEGSLNFLPFEAFISPGGRYLIEDYNVKYIPSASVWASLYNRSYGENRKTLLAMGGATYQEPGGNAGDIRSAESLYELQDKIAQKVNENASNLSTELKALGFGGAHYLAGTLQEVENLKKIIPNATILSANEMKESDIKALNKSGELAKYKWLHIATHGFALDNIPELSGVMMTQPAGGDGNEDDFLLTHEIAGLKLNADLAVLSACETALGKIYGGEGVNGLNSALLTAGANNTMLSLWPVSDAGTMIFMTLVYYNLYTKIQTVDEAVNNAKRSLLAGDYGAQFATPIIWAPFVLSGK
jgi:CHAT domain-containing protein